MSDSQDTAGGLPAPAHQPLALRTKPTATASVRVQPLLPWHRAFARWLVWPDGPTRPTIAQQTKRASELAGVPIHRLALAYLKRRDDFRAYVAKVEESTIARARDTLEAQYADYVAAHKQGLDMAVEAGDYRVVPKFTVPILDRVAPRKVEQETHHTNVVIRVTTQQAERLASLPLLADPDEVVVEAIPVEDDDD